jgi:hypothetical protein
MCSRLPSSAKNAEDVDVHAGEGAGGRSGGSGGAQVGDGICWNEEAWLGGGAVHQEVGGFERLAGFGRNKNELGAERAACGVGAGHDEEKAVRKLHVEALGLNDGAVAVAESLGDEADKADGIEEEVDVLVGQGLHWCDSSRAAAVASEAAEVRECAGFTRG